MLTRLHLEREFRLEHDACPGKEAGPTQPPLMAGIGAPTGKPPPESLGTVHEKLPRVEIA